MIAMDKTFYELALKYYLKAAVQGASDGNAAGLTILPCDRLLQLLNWTWNRVLEFSKIFKNDLKDLKVRAEHTTAWWNNWQNSAAGRQYFSYLNSAYLARDCHHCSNVQHCRTVGPAGCAAVGPAGCAAVLQYCSGTSRLCSPFFLSFFTRDLTAFSLHFSSCSDLKSPLRQPNSLFTETTSAHIYRIVQLEIQIHWLIANL